jgi:hypothetical protein
MTVAAVTAAMRAAGNGLACADAARGEKDPRQIKATTSSKNFAKYFIERLPRNCQNL